MLQDARERDVHRQSPIRVGTHPGATHLVETLEDLLICTPQLLIRSRLVSGRRLSVVLGQQLVDEELVGFELHDAGDVEGDAPPLEAVLKLQGIRGVGIRHICLGSRGPQVAMTVGKPR